MTWSEFVLARVAEDEAVAESLRHPGNDPWGWQPHSHPLATSDLPMCRVVATPARILAECESKRQIIARETSSRTMKKGAPPYSLSQMSGEAMLVSLEFEDSGPRYGVNADGRIYERAPRTYDLDAAESAAFIEEWSDPITDTPIIRLLALPYADHPDYPQEV